MSNFKNLEQFKSWAKDNAFVYPSSEIYGGFAAVYDYGHYGSLLLKNIKDAWQKSMVQENDDIVGLDSGIFMHPKTWHASGHVESFDDPQMDCKKCKNRIRVDHYLEKFGLDVDRWPLTDINIELDKLRAEKKLVCEKCGSADITPAKQFNLLVKTNIGSPTDAFSEDNVVYARGETCQGIYLNYKNVVDTMRVKLPFGIAQIGKAFRNEIVARQFVFRTREFEQMEMQYFLHPSLIDAKYDEWKEIRMNWYENVLGINKDKLRFKPHEKLAHYAAKADDIEYNFESLGGFKEIEGVHQRGDWDLTRHAEYSGQKMTYFDQGRNESYVPHIMETSAGANRVLMMVLEDGLTAEELINSKGEKDTRFVLKIKKELAPIKIAFLPLSRKPDLQNKAKEIKQVFASKYMTEYDETASIGKRYRRQDEIGTPYCVTIDFETLEDEAVTVRDRDTMKQERIKIADLEDYFTSVLN
jgi:glycyl-tRNA synthetase